MTDRGLIEQFVRNNSQAAFGQLVQRHAALVYSTCRRELSDAALAEDCTQAVFLILARKANRLLRIGSLTGWLFTTARLAARDTIKQEARRKRRESAIMEHVQTETEREATAWNAIEPELNDTLASMPSVDRDLILMRFVEQFSHADIAATVGIKEDAARIRVSRAVDRLRTRLLSRLGAGAGVLAGVVLADLLAGRAVDATSLDVASHLTAISHWPTSLPAANAAPVPHAHSIAQGALRIMSRTTVIKAATAVVAGVGIVVFVSSPMVAKAHLLPSGRLLMYVPPRPQTAAATSTAPIVNPAPDPTKTGYSETYRFQISGKDVGSQTATLTESTPAGETWTFTTNLKVPVNGQDQVIAEDGSVGFTSSGHPNWVKLTANVAGSKQVVSIDFTKPPVSMSALVNGLNVSIGVPYVPTDYLSIGNNMSFASHTLRHMDRPAGKDLVIPFVSVDGPMTGAATWSSMGKEPINVGGQSVDCSIYDMTDIRIDQQMPPVLITALKSGIGSRVWLDASGSIIKLEKSKQNLVVTRE